MRKLLFEIKVQSSTDIITNSSSELFVMNLEKGEEVEELLDNVYPDWRSEYLPPLHIDKAELSDIDEYIRTWSYNRYSILEVENKEDLKFRFSREYEEIQKNIFKNPYKFWFKEHKLVEDDCLYEFHGDHLVGLSQKGFEIALSYLKKVSPGTYFLFSIDQNPEWEWQMKLMTIAKRYHLG